jgi:hypothetical protein
MSIKIRDCAQFQENIRAYMDSELDADFRAAMDAHLISCPKCALELDQVTWVMTRCAELDEGLVMPRPAKAAWREAIVHEMNRKKAPAIGFFARSVSLLAAAFLILAVGTQSLRNQGAFRPVSNSGPVANTVAGIADPNYEIAFPALTAALPASFGYFDDHNLYIGRDGAPDEQNAEEDPLFDEADELLLDDDDQWIEGEGEEWFEIYPIAPSESERRVGGVIIRSVKWALASTSFDHDLKVIRDNVAEYGAHFDLQEIAGTPLNPNDLESGRTAALVARVPGERLDDFLLALEAVGDTILRTEISEDATLNYTDAQAKSDSLEAQRDALYEMFAGAETVNDMILIDARLSEVLLEIDQLERSLRIWDSLSDYSEVKISMTETSAAVSEAVEETPLIERMSKSFWNSMEWMKVFLKDAAVVLAMAAPQLIIWIPALILFIIIIRVIVAITRRSK